MRIHVLVAHVNEINRQLDAMEVAEGLARLEKCAEAAIAICRGLTALGQELSLSRDLQLTEELTKRENEDIIKHWLDPEAFGALLMAEVELAKRCGVRDNALHYLSDAGRALRLGGMGYELNARDLTEAVGACQRAVCDAKDSLLLKLKKERKRQRLQRQDEELRSSWKARCWGAIETIGGGVIVAANVPLLVPAVAIAAVSTALGGGLMGDGLSKIARVEAPQESSGLDEDSDVLDGIVIEDNFVRINGARLPRGFVS